MKKTVKFIIIIITLFVFFFNFQTVYALGDIDNRMLYTVYDEFGNFLFEKYEVYVGDYYISKNYNKYEVVKLNPETKKGTAKFLYTVERPNVEISDIATQINTTDKKICLYMTHNDESYVPTDKTESIYGKGGIHDVAKRLANSLRQYGIETYIDETLHIPHDSYAYSRSKITAKNLINNYNPNAIFDIHRDGTSRSYYINNDSGREKSMVRIVVGKGNTNMNINEQFAIYLMSVADEIAPDLIKDIYYASGHYNQELSPKSLLFEMGCHLMEKELVLESADALANVINTALFNTTVNESSGDLTINDIPTNNSPSVDEALDIQYEKVSSNTNLNGTIWIIVSLGLIITVVLIIKSEKRR